MGGINTTGRPRTGLLQARTCHGNPASLLPERKRPDRPNFCPLKRTSRSPLMALSGHCDDVCLGGRADIRPNHPWILPPRRRVWCRRLWRSLCPKRLSMAFTRSASLILADTLGSRHQCGIRPHLLGSKDRSPVLWFWRMTNTSWPGAAL
jgi:hypothetical protein